MIYKEEKRDLFSLSKDYSLAQCISADFGMGKGIAVEFNNHFDMKNKVCDIYGKEGSFTLSTIPSNCLYVRLSHCINEPDFGVFNLITKDKYWGKPTYLTLTNSLYTMKRKLCLSHKEITKIAMPKIGCGLDKLKWNAVSEIIQDTFNDTDLEILVCYI